MSKTLPIEKIKFEFSSLLSDFPSENPTTLTYLEYTNFKSNYINQEPSYKDLFEEIDTYLPAQKILKKSDLVTELSNIFLKTSEIQKKLFTKASELENSLKKVKTEKSQIGENLNKRGISEDSQLTINILTLELLNSSSNSANFKIKFMFENNIVTSESIKSEHFVKQTII